MNIRQCKYLSSSKFTFCIIFIAGLLSSCTPHVPPEPTSELSKSLSGFPETYYQQAQIMGSKVLRINTLHSLVTIKVQRGGVFSQLGHDHIVASRHVTGYVDITNGRADLYIALDRLTVDEAQLRTEAGLTSTPTMAQIEGTKQNMLVKVLETNLYPYARVRINKIVNEDARVSAEIALHGNVRRIQVPIKMQTLQSGITIDGELVFNQSDFGITPYSVLGGALQVLDQLELHFKIFTENIQFG